MNCPNCTSEMERHTRHGVVIDHCPSCGGVWLDRGELEHLLEAVRPAVALDNPDPAPARPRPAQSTAQSKVQPTVQPTVQPAPEGSHGKRYTAEAPRKAARHEDRGRDAGPRPGQGRRFGGKHSAAAQMKNLLEEIFDFD